MTLRLLQNHLRDIEKRISPACHFDLARQGFHAFFVWNQRDIEVGQRCRRLTPLPLLSPPGKGTIASATRSTSRIWPRSSPRSTGPTLASTALHRTASAPPTLARAIPSGRARTSIVARVR